MRKQQAASWKILKATEPGPAGAVLYLFVMDPVVKDADYTVSRILAEVFPTELQELWTKLREAYAGGMHRLSLQTVQITTSRLPRTPSSPTTTTHSGTPPAPSAWSSPADAKRAALV